MKRIALASFPWVVGLLAIWCAGTASADTGPEAIRKAADVLDNSLLFIQAIQTKIDMGQLTPREGLAQIRLEIEAETQQIKEIRANFLLQEAAETAVGLPMLAGISPVAILGEGETALLTFQFIDPSTGLVTPGPSVGSVTYSLVTPFSDPIMSVALGTSFDAASNFSLGFTMSGFEQLIIAMPFDLSNNPIVLPGVGGIDDNVAEGFVVAVSAVPEPSSLMMCGTGVLGLLGYAWRRRAGSRGSGAAGLSANPCGRAPARLV